MNCVVCGQSFENWPFIDIARHTNIHSDKELIAGFKKIDKK